MKIDRECGQCDVDHRTVDKGEARTEDRGGEGRARVKGCLAFDAVYSRSTEAIDAISLPALARPVPIAMRQRTGRRDHHLWRRELSALQAIGANIIC